MGRVQFSKIIAIVFICAFFVVTHIKAKTWVVDKKSALSTIREAISKASPFDTILINKGVYAEKNIEIRKALFIRGKEYPVIDGQEKYEIFSVLSSDVTIEGIHFLNGGRSSSNDLAGIKVYLSRNVVIRNNVLENMFFRNLLPGVHKQQR